MCTRRRFPTACTLTDTWINNSVKKREICLKRLSTKTCLLLIWLNHYSCRMIYLRQQLMFHCHPNNFRRSSVSNMWLARGTRRGACHSYRTGQRHATTIIGSKSELWACHYYYYKNHTALSKENKRIYWFYTTIHNSWYQVMTKQSNLHFQFIKHGLGFFLRTCVIHKIHNFSKFSLSMCFFAVLYHRNIILQNVSQCIHNNMFSNLLDSQ